MCSTCGCGEPDGARVTLVQGGHDHAADSHGRDHDHDHDHSDGHDHSHGHGHDAPDAGSAATVPAHTILIEQDILAKNDSLAADNRRWLADRRIMAVNLMSSPGSGKTTLLTRTITDLAASVSDVAGRRHIAVIEGDQETLLDAERIRATGAPVVQINTGAGCHLDADMLRRGLDALAPEPDSLLFVENVGNLVCPALFDLGETLRVVVISVTEGDDKPLKYPHMFAAADLVVVNKSDLLPHVDFDVDRCVANARTVRAGVDALVVSAKTGEGLGDWYARLEAPRLLDRVLNPQQ